MPELVVPVKRTAVTMADYVRSVVRSWSAVGTGVPLEKSIAVLWAQYMIETGGAACWNYNLGNVKHVQGDGHNYQMLGGVWEGVIPVLAAQLIAAGQAVADTNPSHIKAVGENKKSVIFQPPNPATWFRAFATLDQGMAEQLQILAKRFSKAWPAVLAGDYASFASLLHAQGYFTASADAYAAGMKAPFNALVASSTYEDLIASTNAAPEHTAEDVADSDAVLWDRDIELENLVTVAHEEANNGMVDDMLADREQELNDRNE